MDYVQVAAEPVGSLLYQKIVLVSGSWKNLFSLWFFLPDMYYLPDLIVK